jgi:hypothetical protein
MIVWYQHPFLVKQDAAGYSEIFILSIEHKNYFVESSFEQTSLFILSIASSKSLASSYCMTGGRTCKRPAHGY